MASTTMQYFSTNLSDNISDSEDNYNESSSEEHDEELDEEEINKRKIEYTNQMIDLERQFESIKNQLFKERINQIEKKLEELKTEVSDDYLLPLQELQENMKIRTEVAGILKELRLENVYCQHEAEKQAAKQNFEMQKLMLKEQFRLELEEKLRRLEEDRNSTENYSWDDNYSCKKKKRFNYTSNNLVTSFESCFLKDQLILPDRRKKPLNINGPYIVYMLHDTEIMEDWNLIKKAIKSSNSFPFL